MSRILGDWGTSHLRLFRLEGGRVVARVEGPGIGRLDGPPIAALKAALAELGASGERVTLCGMAGSRNGLVEVGYAECPCDAAGWRGQATRTEREGVPLIIAAGLACTGPQGAPDVMRGEETQIFGAMTLEPSLARGRHRLVLPGTHSKWVTVEDGRVLHFGTWFTGELYALLCEESTLTRAGGEGEPGDADAGFEAGLARARATSDLLGALFTARTAQLREGRSESWARGYLSGLLVGSEIRGALAEAGQVTLIGGTALAATYGRALAAFGTAAAALDGEACAIAGLELIAEPEGGGAA